MAAVTVAGLHKSFGATPVLRDVSLPVRDGEFLALVGPSGCGKTTLLRIVAGLDHADAGSVLIDGHPVDALPPKRRDVAMVFQSYALYPYMSVRENLALPLVMRRLTRWQRLPLLGPWWPGARAARRRIEERVDAAAAPLGLAPLLDRRPAQLSGGQRQRVALGRAMVREPKFFLMDDPLSNLDAKLRVATRSEIAQLHRSLGTTFVYVTHDQVEAMTMSDRVALMMDGRVLQLATPQDIYDDPCDLRVAEFIGTPKINVLRAQRVDGALRVAGQRWPLDVGASAAAPAAAAVQIAVRPEWLALREAGAIALQGEALLEGVVAHQELLGCETLVHVRVPGQAATVVAKVPPAEARGLAIGQALALATRRALAFDEQGVRLRELQWRSEPRLGLAGVTEIAAALQQSAHV
jgi:multiple sugar transport system ATP-binding protein